MAFSLKFGGPRGSVGLDLDDGFVAAAMAPGGVVGRAVSAELPAGAMRDGEVAETGALRDALRQLFRSESLPRRVRLGVANRQIVVRQLELPRIEDPREREAAIRYQAQETIAMPLDEVVLDHQVIGEIADGDGPPRTLALVVAARQEMIGNFVEAVRGAGLRPLGIDLNAFALLRALGDASAPGGQARVHCHLAGVTNLAIAAGQTCLFTRTLQARWPEADAAHHLAEEVRLSLDFHATRRDAPPIAEVVLSGPGSADEGLIAGLTERLPLPVVVAPEPRFADGALALGEDPRRHAIAAGLALGEAA